MARPELTSEEKAAFRARICEAALGLFASHGYEGFSLRALARALGCSHTTPYRYFSGKEEIFAAVRQEGFRRFAELLRREAGDVEDCEARLHALAHAYLGFARDQPEAFRALFELGQPRPESYPQTYEAGREAWGVLEGAVRDAVRRGVLSGEPEIVAHLFWAGVHGVSTLDLAGRLIMGRQAGEIVAPMVEALLAAHRPQTNDTPSAGSGTRGGG